MTTRRLITHAEAVDWARAFAFGHCRLEPYIPKGPIHDHDAKEYFFFRIAGSRFKVARNLVIAVRRTDGRISQCGRTGECTPHPLAAG